MKDPSSSLAYFLKPYPRFVLGILWVTLLCSILESLNVAAFFPVFHSILKGTAAGSWDRPLQFFLQVTRWIPSNDPLVSAVALLFLVTLAKCSLVLIRDSLIAGASGTVEYDLKNRLMKCYAGSSYPFFIEHKQGQLIYNTSTAASRVGVLTQKVPQLLAELLKMGAIGVLLLMTMPMVTVGLVVIGLGYHGLTDTLSKKVSYHTGRGRVVAGAAQASVANEFFTGIRQIIAFDTQPMWLERFRQQSLIFRDLYVRDSIWLAFPKVLLELATVSLLFGLLLFLHVRHPELLAVNLPLVGVFALGLLRLLPSLTHVGQLRMEIVGLMADAEVVRDALTHPIPRPIGGRGIFGSLHQGISLEAVHFAYPDREHLFRGIDVTFERGKVTAIVGPSGSGKSTTAYLLLGLLEPTEGQILIDRVDLREIQLESWRNRIGFVSQDLFISHASVAENIAFGRPGYSLADIQRAAGVANAHAFIEQLPQGYETIVGERGMKLSGGQQQRIVIARAILHDPEVLILDEATSFLDAESERLVQQAIEKISRDRTVILIAHRFSTVQKADKIVVLDQGKIVEEGSHQELLKGQGRYFQLVATALG